MRNKLLVASVLFFFIMLLLFNFGERYYAAIILHLIIFFVSLFFLYEKSLENTLQKLGLFNRPLTQIVYGILGFIIMIFTTIILNIVFYYLGVADGYKIVETVKDFPEYLLFFAMFFAPISEELFFRATVLIKSKEFIKGLIRKSKYAENVSLILSLVFTSILFAFAHLAYHSITQFIGAFLMGLILCGMYLRAKNIVPVIVAHFLFNLTSLMLIKTLYGI